MRHVELSVVGSAQFRSTDLSRPTLLLLLLFKRSARRSSGVRCPSGDQQR